MKRLSCLAAAVASLTASVATATGPAASAPSTTEQPAVVQLGDIGAEAPPVVRGQSPELPGTVIPETVVNGGSWDEAGGVPMADSYCPDGTCNQGGYVYDDGSHDHGRQHHISGWITGQSELYRNRNLRNSGRFAGYMRAKFGYFVPTGNCGKGVPLYGKYHMTYAQNPEHVDARDGQAYQAPGYGTPVNVPLAPNVRHTYNYGWGIPSSRLTPLRQATVVAPPVDTVHGPMWK